MTRACKTEYQQEDIFTSFYLLYYVRIFSVFLRLIKQTIRYYDAFI